MNLVCFGHVCCSTAAEIFKCRRWSVPNDGGKSRKKITNTGVDNRSHIITRLNRASIDASDWAEAVVTNKSNYTNLHKSKETQRRQNAPSPASRNVSQLLNLKRNDMKHVAATARPRSTVRKFSKHFCLAMAENTASSAV